jgi:Uncharacterized protein conserved in bacteria (DUF2330)
MKRLATIAASLCVIAQAFVASTVHACGLARTWEDLIPFGARTEDAVIVWDRQHHIEHFIREAVFGTRARSFGLLVPLPGRPTLAEASERVFPEVDDAIPWRLEDKTITYRSKVGCATSVLLQDHGVSAPNPAAREGGVELERTRVAGLDASILAATDTDALSVWLTSHGFQLRDALKRWLAKYVAKNWYLAAFRYEQPMAAGPSADGDSIASRAVRLSFPADTPMYPYFEPDDTPSVDGRWLRLYVIADAPVDAVLDDAAATPWSAQRESMTTPNLSAAWSALPGLEAPADARWVTSFVDNVSRRPDADVLFRTNASLAPKERLAYHLDYEEGIPYVPVDIALPAMFILWQWRRSEKRKRSGSTAPAVAGGSTAAAEKKIAPDVDPGSPRST